MATNAPHHPYNVADKYSAPYKNNLAITNANFYGMIANIDENVGKLRSELKKMGLDENTILVYMSDNGTATGVKFNTKNEVVSGYNAGMRGIKGSPYDGGHRVPLILHWPKAGIDKGKELSTLTSYIDFAPTILELCNVLPASNQTFDGKSLKPLILSTCANWPERILIVDNQREEFLKLLRRQTMLKQAFDKRPQRSRCIIDDMPQFFVFAMNITNDMHGSLWEGQDGGQACDFRQRGIDIRKLLCQCLKQGEFIATWRIHRSSTRIVRATRIF